jgi:hypothetical protein
MVMSYALGVAEVSAAPYVWTILTALAACVLILAIAALLDAGSEMPLVRFAQQLRLSRTRMGRMLRRRGIRVGAYAGSLSAVTLQRQAAICGRCGSTAMCDRALRSRGGAHSHTRYTFCPNQDAVERYLIERAHIQV